MSHVFMTIISLSRKTRDLGRLSRNISSFHKYNLLAHTNFEKIISCEYTSKTNGCASKAVNAKKFCSKSSDYIVNNEIDNFFIETIETQDKFHNNFLNSLYPDENDHIISQLNSCSSIQDVFNIIKKCSSELQNKHLCQALIVLINMQKKYYDSFILNLLHNDLKHSPTEMLNQYIENLKSHEEFQSLLSLIEKNCGTFTFEELSCCLLYLKKVHLKYTDNIMEKLLTCSHDKIILSKEECTLRALARYTGFLGSRVNLLYFMLAKDVSPLVVDYIDKCSSTVDLELITVCLYNLQNLITEDILKIYKHKAQSIIGLNATSDDIYKIILKVINLLNIPHWSKNNLNEIVSMTKLVENYIDKMEAHELIYLHKIFHSQLEPATIIPPLLDKTQKLIEVLKNDDSVRTYQILPDLLLCQITSSLPQDRPVYENMVSGLLKAVLPSTLQTIYKIIRYLKITKIDICNQLWDISYESCLLGGDDTLLLHLSHKYLYFHNNFSDVYRNFDWEKKIVSCLVNFINNGDAGFIPWKFSRAMSFIIPYGFPKLTIEINTINQLVEKLDKISNQLNILDCLSISKGLQISYDLMANRYTSPTVTYNLQKIDGILERCTARHLESENDINDMNNILKTIINRKSRLDTELFHKLLDKFSTADGVLSSRVVRDCSYNLMSCSTIVPSVVDRLVDYVASRDGEVLGETALKLLVFCYNSGYTLKNDNFFKTTIKSVYRDKETMSGLSLLNCCQALCFYNHLPDILVDYIFSIQFMERIDAEIASCYSRKTYPYRIRMCLMSLNRAVCLELPQYKVPWFHQNYIQELNALSTTKTSLFHNEVLEVLTKVIGRKEAIKYPFFTPYGYKIDFLIHHNKKGIFLPYSHTTKTNTKIAVLLATSDSFFKSYIEKPGLSGDNFESIGLSMKGPIQTMHRHLEQMEYKVIEISLSNWNSMHMAEPEAKINYIKNELRI